MVRTEEKERSDRREDMSVCCDEKGFRQATRFVDEEGLGGAKSIAMVRKGRGGGGGGGGQGRRKREGEGKMETK